MNLLNQLIKPILLIYEFTKHIILIIEFNKCSKLLSCIINLLN